ncbi:hypothetical protein C8R45DRAFT_765228, partial [Mycena sanguinolenta]
NIDTQIELQVKDSPVSYLLRGVIYLGDNHFTVRLIRRTGQCWYHDSQQQGGLLICEGNLRDQT